ncbi:MAG TPA: prepilin-type N-terminal cleavage/methylation domain-containing protein [Kofleriaceae bacterium]
MRAATTTASPAPAARRGFTLLEVMLGLALLGLGLTVLIKSTASDIFNAQQAHLMGVVTDLARGKMYDIEEKLLHDGFSDTEQHEDDKNFSDEGWPQIHYSYKVEVVELPGFEQLQAIIAGTGSGSARSAAGSDGEAAGGFENSMLGGMMAQFGGLGGGGGGKGSADINASIGGAFVQSQYSMFQQILKVTIRKITLTVNYQVMGSDRDLKVVQFLTDAAAMDKVLNGMGANELPAAGSGSSGSNSPPTTKPPTTPPTQPPKKP